MKMRQFLNFFFLFYTSSIIIFTSCAKEEEGKPELAITSIHPTSGPKATVVIINGTGFSSNASENKVFLNDIECPINDATSTALTITIPAKAGSGSINIQVNEKTIEGPRFEYVYSQAIVSTVAGSTAGFVDGVGSSAKFNMPIGIALASDGSLFVTDAKNHAIRKVTSTGDVSTINGAATLDLPTGVVALDDGSLFVADGNKSLIFKISPMGVMKVFAGMGGDGHEDGSGASARFFNPVGIALGSENSLYVADAFNYRIRKISSSGVVSTVAGQSIGTQDGTRASAGFYNPTSVAVDFDGNLLVADESNHRIRKVTQAGVVTTLAGSSKGFTDGPGNQAKFHYPYGVAVGPDGTIYVADKYNNRIRKVSPTGDVSTLAGGTAGTADGIGTAAQFYLPSHLIVDKESTIYVTDTDNHRIRRIVQE